MRIESLNKKEDYIHIKESKTADTRTCDVSKVSKTQLLDSSRSHISDVKQGMKFFADMLVEQSKKHDFTKLENIDEFFEDFKNEFKDSKWWIKHQDKERHHLGDKKYIQDDVNLIDVLEMLVDCVMAGLTRSGKYRQEDFPDNLLKKAFDNTVDLLLKKVKVKKDEG